MTLLLTAGAISAQQVIPDFYRDPGLYPNRSYVNQTPNEHIDPFTGGLQFHYTDIAVPGNGGFDLKVIRSYNSESIDPLNPSGYESMAGLGWTIHFGRVLKTGTTPLCVSSGTITGSPVMELPDGSRQLMVFTGNTSPLMLSTQRWRAECLGSGTGLSVYSPDGVRYDMTQSVNVSVPGGPIVTAWYTKTITDRNGNYATVNYAGTASQEISSIAANDGRVINFVYAGSGTSARRITSINTSGYTYNYGYQAVTGVPNAYFLTSVTRPDGWSWSYTYNGNLSSTNLVPGSYVMRSITYPEGGTITYGYAFVNFDAQSSQTTTVISSKTASIGGNWSFQYRPGNIGAYDVTTVTAPAGTTTYSHVGPNYSSSGTVWMIGLLAAKTYSDNFGLHQSETYAWSKQKISSLSNFRSGQFGSKIDTDGVNAPLLTQKAVTRDNITYTTGYSNFDAYGNPASITEAGTNGGSRSTAITYYVNTTKWIINQPQNESFAGSSVSRTFDSNANLTAVTRDGVTSSYIYDSQGNVYSATFPRGLVHTYSSYYRGIPRSESQPEGITISRIVSDAGNVTSETNGDLKTTTYTYDGLNRVTRIGYPTGNAVTISYTGNSKTATRGILQEVINDDGLGRPSSVTLGGIARTYGYDALGRKTFESDPGSSTGTSYTYDILNRITRVTHADGKTVSISYGAASKSITDENQKTTTYTYRSYGNPDQQFVMSMVAPETSANVTIARNSKDLMTSVVQAGLTRSYGYNSNYYLTSITNPETGTTSYGRDAAGNMTSRSTGTSGTSSYVYDGQNRLSSVSYPNGAAGTTPAVNNAYNHTNKLLSASSSVANRSYSYDDNGNLNSETLAIDSITLTAAYAYDGNDQLNTVTYPYSGKAVTYSPDVLGRPSQVSGYVSSASYWPTGQIKQINYANGSVTSYGQNNRLWPASFSTQKTTTTYVNSSYSYDGTGNLTNIADSTDSSYNRTLGYDGINRLTSASGPWGSGSIAYSGAGNVTSQILGSSSLSYSYDNSNRLTGISGSRSASYGYDAYGDVISATGNAYSYDGVPNLVCVNCTDSANKIAYTYDATNHRVSVTKAGVKTYELYDAKGNLLVEYTPTASNKLIEYIYLGGKRVAQRVSTTVGTTVSATVNAFHNDISGTPQLATDASGNLLWKENYRPYGDKLNNQAASGTNNLGFTGKPYDSNTGLSYMGARYYNPVLGRFMGVDPKGFDTDNLHSFNRYAYGNNNPYKFVDPDGRNGILAALVIVGVALEVTDLATSDAPVTGGSLAKMGVKAAEHVAEEITGHVGEAATTATANKVVTINKSRFPESAAHIEDAIQAGQPSTLTIDRAGATARRRESMKGTTRSPGLDRDEYPPAMFKEGGTGSSVRPIKPSDNRGAGACIGAQCSGLANGTKVDIQVTN